MTRDLRLLQADITTLQVDAVVNAAKSMLSGGGGVDGAIHRAAGPELRRACRALAPVAEGECVATDAFRMPCRRIIHAVGPRWRGGGAGEAERLAACYRNALDAARREGLRSVAFPCIATGGFHFPADLAARIAVETVRSHAFDGTVIFCVARDEDRRLYEKLLADLARRAPRS